MLPQLRFDQGQAFRVATELAFAGPALAAKVYLLTRHYGMLLQTAVKAHASRPRSGPPGPRIQTGDYNRSISLHMGISEDGPAATVGTNKPQGRRLEFGFVGIDSLGRSYDQPPYPHFRPALDLVSPQYVAAVTVAVQST